MSSAERGYNNRSIILNYILQLLQILTFRARGTASPHWTRHVAPTRWPRNTSPIRVFSSRHRVVLPSTRLTMARPSATAAFVVLLLSLLAVAHCRTLESEPAVDASTDETGTPPTAVAVADETVPGTPIAEEPIDVSVPAEQQQEQDGFLLRLPSHRRQHPCRHGLSHRHLWWARHHDGHDGHHHHRFHRRGCDSEEEPRVVAEEGGEEVTKAVAEPDPDRSVTDSSDGEKDGDDVAAVKRWRKEMVWRMFRHGMRHHRHHHHHNEEEEDEEDHRHHHHDEEDEEDRHGRRHHRHHHHEEEEDEEDHHDKEEEGPAGRHHHNEEEEDEEKEKKTRKDSHHHRHRNHDDEEEKTRKPFHHADDEDEDDDMEEIVRRFRKAIMRRRFHHGHRFFRHHHYHHAEEAKEQEQQEGGVGTWIKGLMNRF
ncbi:hypothetical protein QOZ80_2AG0108160 [Eleusine coracana subsp. coracana]|nr:hypothetical protein QOZ80_2AG0108160 [Eleusine coracana subsp. coracana]